MKFIFFTLHLAMLPLFAQEANTVKSFFEIPLKEGVQFDSTKLDGFFSSELLKLRNDMKPKDLVQAFPSAGFGKPDTFMSGKTPKNSYLETIEVYYELGKINNFAIRSIRVPPGKERFLAWMLELERLIGPPNLAFQELNGNQPDKQTLMVLWSPSPNALMLELERGGDTLRIKLTYYPGPANPGLKRTAAIKRQPVAFKSFESLIRDYITQVGIFPEGDAAISTLKVPEGEPNLLSEYHKYRILNMADMSREDKEVKLPLIKKIEEALDKHYEKMTDKEKWERLALIAEGKVPGLASGEVQVGAARFLAQQDEAEVFQYLLRGLKVEVPSGVSSECQTGIAERCDDALFDKLLEMNNTGQLSHANLARILVNMPSKRHLEMLVRKREKLTGDHRELVELAIMRLGRYKLVD